MYLGSITSNTTLTIRNPIILIVMVMVIALPEYKINTKL